MFCHVFLVYGALGFFGLGARYNDQLLVWGTLQMLRPFTAAGILVIPGIYGGCGKEIGFWEGDVFTL